MSSLQSNLLENHTPTGREEAWRFTPLKRLGGLHDGSATVDTRHSLVINDALEAGVSFAYGALVTASASSDLIVNRVRNHTEEGSILSYKCTDVYNKESEGSLLWSDPEIGIDWNIEDPIVSEKDQISPNLSEFETKFI